MLNMRIRVSMGEQEITVIAIISCSLQGVTEISAEEK
jgi:hypothetical protein